MGRKAWAELQAEGVARPVMCSSVGVHLQAPAEAGRLADFCIGHCERKKWLSKFPQILADPSKNVKIGDNVFTQSFPRALSNKGAAPSWWGRGRKKELSQQLTHSSPATYWVLRKQSNQKCILANKALSWLESAQTEMFPCTLQKSMQFQDKQLSLRTTSAELAKLFHAQESQMIRMLRRAPKS